MYSWISVLISLFLMSVAYMLHSLRRKERKNDFSLPPGPRGLPVLGNLHTLGDLPHRNLDRLAKKYGPIMYIRLGHVPAVVVSSPQTAELFLKTYDIVFANRPKIQAAEYMSYGQKGLVFSDYGPYWRNMRKLCTLELLSNLKIESLKPSRREELECLVMSLKDAAKVRAVVDLSAKVGSFVEDITYQMIFGCKEARFSFQPLVHEALRLTGAFNLADYVPCVRALDLQGLTRSMKAISKVVDEFLEKIIDEHVQDGRERQMHNRDFIDVMLSLMESKDAQEEKLDRTNIKAIILDMVAGAMDTSSTAIEWALSELLRHPRVMKRVQEEVGSVVSMDRVVEETDLVKFDYLNMVVKESMRLHPVAPLLIPHESREDITINGYHIPKKSRIIINSWAIGRDPNIWSNNAEEFSPERFIGANIDIQGHHFQLIPFGSGRRRCPGMQLGLTAVQLVLAQLVHCFDWELPNGISPCDLDMSEKFGLSMPRANHLLAIPTYRLCVDNL